MHCQVDDEVCDFFMPWFYIAWHWQLSISFIEVPLLALLPCAAANDEADAERCLYLARHLELDLYPMWLAAMIARQRLWLGWDGNMFQGTCVQRPSGTRFLMPSLRTFIYFHICLNYFKFIYIIVYIYLYIWCIFILYNSIYIFTVLYVLLMVHWFCVFIYIIKYK